MLNMRTSVKHLLYKMLQYFILGEKVVILLKLHTYTYTYSCIIEVLLFLNSSRHVKAITNIINRFIFLNYSNF